MAQMRPAPGGWALAVGATVIVLDDPGLGIEGPGVGALGQVEDIFSVKVIFRSPSCPNSSKTRIKTV